MVDRFLSTKFGVMIDLRVSEKMGSMDGWQQRMTTDAHTMTIHVALLCST